MKIELKTRLHDFYSINALEIHFDQSQLRIVEKDKENSYWFIPTDSLIAFKVEE